MEITNGKLARDFVEAWEKHGRRLGIFREALRGLRIARSIAQGRVYSDETRANYDEAILVLEIAVLNATPVGTIEIDPETGRSRYVPA